MAGRLHVEVMRISGEIGERIAGGEDATDASFEKEAQENKLVCMVSHSGILEWLKLRVLGIYVINIEFLPGV